MHADALMGNGESMAEGRRPSGRPTTWDWLLGVLIRLVNSTEQRQIRLGIPVTLNVGGFLLSGYMIGGREYFEEFSRTVEEGLPDELVGEEGQEGVAAPFRRLTDLYSPEEDVPEGRLSQERFDFVHLRDARFFHPDSAPLPSNQGILWRCKLEAVDGFTLGLLTAEPIEATEKSETGEPDEE
jgi:hypothetical protein